jgi:hypothetical protein
MPREYGHDEIVTDIDKALIDIINEVLSDLHQNKNLQNDIIFLSKIEQLKNLLKDNRYELIRRINRSPAEGVKERPDIELFGGYIVIEVKTKDNELKGGEEQLKNYISKYYRDVAKLGIVTTGLKWVIYNWDGKDLRYAGTYIGNENEYIAGSIYNAIINSKNIYVALYDLIKFVLIQSGAYRLVPGPDNIFRAFYPVITYINNLTEIIKNRITETALYQSYREILLRIYRGRDIKEEDLIRLFATHTLLQMIANVVLAGAFGELESAITEPLKACSGELLKFDITIPHLMWWRGVSDDTIKGICEDIFSRALLFNWKSPIVEDVFSHLYEDFVERALRHKIGEYYTPWWLIEFMIKHMKERFNVSFSNKLILDPACGSGRFLVAAFREKINEEKEGDIEKAYYSVVGLDILPLAVTLARAELMIAYYRAIGKPPPGTPLIFWGDFLSSEIGLRAELVREFENISKALAIYTKQEIVDKLFKFEKYELLELLASLEYRLASILERLAYARRSGQVSTVINELRREVEMTRPINSIDNAVSLIIKRVLNDDILNQVLDLIDKYGNEIWAIPIVSNLFVDLLGKVKPDIVLTNPPWILLSQLPESEWGKKVRGIINNLINKYRSSISGISRTGMSGDISAIFLHVILKILEREGYVGIVMPASQSYWPNTPTYVGRLLTYAVLIDSGANVKGDSIFVGDVFGHGDLASVFIIKVSKRNK